MIETTAKECESHNPDENQTRRTLKVQREFGKMTIAFVVLLMIALPMLGACGEKEVVKEVVKEVPVEKEVVKEVVKEVPVEKEVVKEVEVPVEVEKEVIKEVQVAKKDLSVLGLCSLTGLGLAGKNMYWASDDYYDYVNDNGGINGHRIKFAYGDGQYAGSPTLNLYNRLMSGEDNPLVVDMQSGSQVITTLKGKFGQDKIPAVFPSPHDLALYPPAYMFGVGPTYGQQFATWIDWVLADWEESRPLRVAVMGIDAAFGRMVVPTGIPYAEEKGVEIVDQEYYAADTVDFTTYLRRIEENNPDYVWLNVVTHHAAAIMKDAHKLGLPEKMQFVACLASASQETINLLGDLSEGLISMTDKEVWSADEPGHILMRQLQETNRGEIHEDYMYISVFTQAMAIVEAMKVALETVGPDKLDSQAVYEEGFLKIKDMDTMGITNPMTYTADDHRGNPYVKIIEAKDGDWVGLTDWIGPAPQLWPQQ